MITYPIPAESFVPAFLVSGPQVTDFSSPTRGRDQIATEQQIRNELADRPRLANVTCDISHASRLHLPWHVCLREKGVFVNLSSFYSEMRLVRFDVATCLVAPHNCSCTIRVWSWCACDVYLEGTYIGGIATPNYKPVQYTDLTLSLHRGLNSLYIACEALGVRDTRSVIAVQLRKGDELQCTLPCSALTHELWSAYQHLQAMYASENGLHCDISFPRDSHVRVIELSPDFHKNHTPPQWYSLPETENTFLPPSRYDFLEVCVHTPSGDLRRTLENPMGPVQYPGNAAQKPEEAFQKMLQRVAAIETLDHGDTGLPISQILARKALGLAGPNDPALLSDMLDQIEKRVDCADFRIMGLIRYLKQYGYDGLDPQRVREVLTGFRYWMHMDGLDAMCFWSENHSLIFYSSAMFVGEMYPDAWFSRAQCQGQTLAAWGEKHVDEWLDALEQDGFEEFNSGTYMNVTFAALLNLVDYSPRFSARARAAADLLMERLCMHTFRGGLIAPMGRTYRSVLYPDRQAAMALINLVDPSQNYDYGEGWSAFLAGSTYVFPPYLKERIHKEIHTTYTTGNARIFLDKTPDWILTSVASPRQDPFIRWENLTLHPCQNTDTFAYTRSLNERFHGTTCFAPGVHGYQQHMWYAALSPRNLLFANHPGSLDDSGDLRPGYWHGNGIMPALAQERNQLLMIYRIPDSDPIHCIHIFAPYAAQKGHWLFLYEGGVTIGFWSLISPVKAPDREYQIPGSEIPCAVRICEGRGDAAHAAFLTTCEDNPPLYDAASHTLRWGGQILTCCPTSDPSQVI
ncbi:MAG: hypothetical protein IJ246_06885 [Clostridia bacterium]|nr:hypothetical protein [Clostridia bacterium]